MAGFINAAREVHDGLFVWVQENTPTPSRAEPFSPTESFGVALRSVASLEPGAAAGVERLLSDARGHPHNPDHLPYPVKEVTGVNKRPEGDGRSLCASPGPPVKCLPPPKARMQIY